MTSAHAGKQRHFGPPREHHGTPYGIAQRGVRRGIALAERKAS
jgi:hypothetical protein